MLDTILHYLTLIFSVACFTIIYFKLLRATVQRITVKVVANSDFDNFKKNGKVDNPVTTIYTSFMARLVLAFIFFYCLLKYFNTIRDIITICIVFVITRWFIIRYEKKKFAEPNVVIRENQSTKKSTKSSKKK